MQATKGRLALTKPKEVDLNLAAKLHVPFSTLSPKRIKLNTSNEKFQIHKPDELMGDSSDRYAFRARKSAGPKKSNPPKLSPRSNNRSVDPRTRSNGYLMDMSLPGNGNNESWGGTGSLNFGMKKQSMPVGGPKDMEVQGRMTSKYSFNAELQTDSGAGNRSNEKGEKNVKQLKFKDDSPTVTERNSRNTSVDLIMPKKSGVGKKQLNDSSSKQLDKPNETGNFGKRDDSNLRKKNMLPVANSSTLPQIKNFY